jgi:MFS family permease
MTRPLSILYLLSFFLALQFAVTTYINSTYIANFVGENRVGLVYALASVLAVFGLLVVPKWTARIGNFRIASIVLYAMLISLAGLFFIKNAGLGLFFIMAYLFTNILIVFSRDIFIEKYSRHETTGKTRGIFLTAVNLGFVLAPAAAGFLAERSLENVYLLAGLLLIPVIFIIRPFKKFHDPEYEPPSLQMVWKKFREDRNIFKIYIINFVLQFFYVWMVIFMPIYLNRHIGFEWSQIGLIFTIMLLPFVLLQYPLGRLADKIGEKKILSIGIAIGGVATLAVPFIKTPDFFLWAGILFLTRVGAAIIEAMTEIYFFKKVNGRDSEVISFYRNTYPVANIVAPVLASGILLFTSFENLFVILGFFVLSALFFSRSLVDTN